MTPPPLPPDAALFLDFDGCLVQIAPRPDAIIVSPALVERLSRLHDRLDGALALISGRNVADLRGHLQGFEGIVAGSHGAELSPAPGQIRALHEVDIDLPALHRAAHQAASGHPALLVEEKPHGVAIHYRADPSLHATVQRAMEALAQAHPGLTLQPAKMAFELRPGGLGKNDALSRLMTNAPFAGRIPVYAGDDLTDEPAIEEAQIRGGFGIKIGEGPTAAMYHLSDPVALAQWLDAALD